MTSLPSFLSTFDRRRPATRPQLAAWVDTNAGCIGILAILSGFLFFFGVSAGELWRTEGLRAIIGAQMLKSGNWVVPTLYGEPLFTKPPGMYAAIALMSWPFGEVTDWSARLPSALAATATVFLFFWYFSRHLGRLGGLLAAAILPLSPMWLDKASAAEIDTLQMFWVTASLLFFFRAVEDWEDDEDLPRGHVFWWLASLLCVAGGFLTKWTAPAFFYCTALPFLWWRGRLCLLWSRYHLLSVLAAATVCIAWVVAAIAMTNWDIFYLTVKREACYRLVPNYGGDPYPWLESLLHPAKILVTTLPWSILLIWAFQPRFFRLWGEPQQRLIVALHCWVWPNLLFWSLITEHTPRHSFPLFPGIAGLGAMVLLGLFRGQLRWRGLLSARATFITTVVLWLAIKVVFVQVVVPIRNAERQGRHKGLLLASLVPADQILYLFRLKDEGIMFYYGREVLRLSKIEQLTSSSGTRYCILKRSEWQEWRQTHTMEVVRHLTDEQGDPIVLVRIGG